MATTAMYKRSAGDELDVMLPSEYSIHDHASRYRDNDHSSAEPDLVPSSSSSSGSSSGASSRRRRDFLRQMDEMDEIEKHRLSFSSGSVRKDPPQHRHSSHHHRRAPSDEELILRGADIVRAQVRADSQRRGNDTMDDNVHLGASIVRDQILAANRGGGGGGSAGTGPSTASSMSSSSFASPRGVSSPFGTDGNVAANGKFLDRNDPHEETKRELEDNEADDVVGDLSDRMLHSSISFGRNESRISNDSTMSSSKYFQCFDPFEDDLDDDGPPVPVPRPPEAAADGPTSPDSFVRTGRKTNDFEDEQEPQEHVPGPQPRHKSDFDIEDEQEPQAPVPHVPAPQPRQNNFEFEVEDHYEPQAHVPAPQPRHQHIRSFDWGHQEDEFRRQMQMQQHHRTQSVPTEISHFDYRGEIEFRRPTSSAYQEPRRDKAYNHAMKAGLVWQTLVGEHVRFPKKWWGGARTPIMGDAHNSSRPKWHFISRHRVRGNQFLNGSVRNRTSPGRLLLHIVVSDPVMGPVQDVTIGCFHPNARGIRRTLKPIMDDETVREIWMAIRKRPGREHVNMNGGGHGLSASLLNTALTLGHGIEDVGQPSPLGEKHTVTNDNVRAVFGDKPPITTAIVPSQELYKIIIDAVEEGRRLGQVSPYPARTLLQEFLFSTRR